jgi:hypothetical protein
MLIDSKPVSADQEFDSKHSLTLAATASKLLITVSQRHPENMPNLAMELY